MPLPIPRRETSAGDDAPLTVKRLRVELEFFTKEALQQEVRLALEKEFQALRESVAAETRSLAVKPGPKQAPESECIAEGVEEELPPGPVLQRRGRKDRTSGEMSPLTPRSTDTRTLSCEYANVADADLEPSSPRGDKERPLVSPRAGRGGCLCWLARSNAYRVATGSLLLLNSALLGLETDYAARHFREEPPGWFWTADLAFCLVFVADLVLQIFADGCTAFFCGEGWGWNWFDFLTVAIQVFDVMSASQAFGREDSLSANTESLRMLRLVRVLRVARVFNALTSLRRLIVSVFHSITCLVWPMLLILLMTYIYGIFFTQIVTEHKMRLSDEEFEKQEELEEFFGALGSSMLVLFQTISDGIHWGEVMMPLAKFVSPWLTGIFIVYIGFVLFAMMNVITAFFVESAMDAAEREDKEHIVKNLVAAFPTDLAGHGGSISEEDFNGLLDTEHMRDYLQALELSPDDARESRLFRVLDMSGSGSVNTTELLDSCQRVMGGAKALDLAALACSFRAEVLLAARHRRRVEALLHRALGE